MTEEQNPDIEELKERIEIPVEDETEQLKAQEKGPEPEVVEEFRRLGRQFAETIEAAWNSEERRRVEQEVRQGVRSFADEVDKVIREAKKSPPAERIKGEAVEVKERVETSDLGRRAREGIVQGLGWMSEELAKLAQQFAPTEKSPEDVGPDFAPDAPPQESETI